MGVLEIDVDIFWNRTILYYWIEARRSDRREGWNSDVGKQWFESNYCLLFLLD